MDEADEGDSEEVSRLVSTPDEFLSLPHLSI
jgi:hypothetical protein